MINCYIIRVLFEISQQLMDTLHKDLYVFLCSGWMTSQKVPQPLTKAKFWFYTSGNNWDQTRTFGILGQ